jgi:hypothetical protein
MVVKNNELKIAQYGQWDGYPSGQGSTVLEFLNTANIPEFIEKLDNVKFFDIKSMTEEEIAVINEDKEKKYDHLSRDHGAKILELVDQGACELVDQHAFSENSSCEWAYLINFDKKVLEVYGGYGTDVLEGGFLSTIDNLEPIDLVKIYSLDSLPSLEQFIKDLDPDEED